MDPAIPASRTLCGLGLRVSVYLFGNITKSLNQKSREKRSCQRTEDRWRRAEGPSEIIKGISPQLNSPEEFNGARGVNMVQRTEGREQRVHCLLLP